MGKGMMQAVGQVVVEARAGQDWAGAFAGWLAGRGKGEKTVRAYLAAVGAFAGWSEEVNRTAFAPEMVTNVDLQDYRRWALEVKQMAPASWNLARAGLAAFCEWAQGAGHLNYNPFRDIRAAEQVELAPRWLSRAEWGRFMRVVEQAANTARTAAGKRQAARDLALVALLGWAGLREAEAASLQIADLEIGERKGVVHVRLGKGSKKRDVPLNAEARRALNSWRVEGGGWSDKSRALFVGKGGSALGVRGIQRRIRALGQMAGLEGVTPHVLRHTFAKRALDAGAQLTEVAKLLGHARLETTGRYVMPGMEDLERAVERI